MEDIPDDSLFLGLDNSTQSLKATVLDSSLNIVCTEIINFDTELPHYKTKGGVHRDPFISGRITSPTLMWIEALDVILLRLQTSPKLDIDKIVAVSGSAQQHGSVYWKKGSLGILSYLDSKKPLVEQFENAFSTKDSPIWMDNSTTEQCEAIEKALGGALELAKLTGSRAHERCTGPQIRRIYETCPQVYHNTERISLVSSFMACILIGGYACIDHTDGAGMNLMDIKERAWSNLALEATAPGLEDKLGNLAPAHAIAGLIAPYFVERFQFNKDCLVIQWSGDNPNSLAGLTLNTPGDLAISLGTSDTVFGITMNHSPNLEGNFFPNPVDKEGYMVMLVYKNGSLTREDIRDRCAERSWEVFNHFLQQTPPLNFIFQVERSVFITRIMKYYLLYQVRWSSLSDNLDYIFFCRQLEQWMLIHLLVGFHRYALEDFDGKTLDRLVEHEVKNFDPPSEVRALVEGQFVSMRGHIEKCGMLSPPERIIATGGASANHDSASLGAALRAAHGLLCYTKGGFVPISGLYIDKLEKTALGCKLAVASNHTAANYASFVKKRMEIENRLVETLGRR
uniref:xylulose kinase 2-like isoform X2 n=1 Tax=Erigeron canadensis TaxID=72917 RepID=UPI001CB8BF0D|nr:xylulose kinase 2-like isoform X2 [Erigeron canadensis]